MTRDERPRTRSATVRQSAVASPELPYRAAALALWPRLDRDRLRHCKDDPLRIARLVEHRTATARDCIVAMLEKTARAILAQHATPEPARVAINVRPMHRPRLRAPLVMTVGPERWPVVLVAVPDEIGEVVAA